MPVRKLETKILLAMSAFIIFCGTSYGSQNKQIPKGCKWVEINTGPFQSRVERVVAAVEDFNNWPQSDLLKVSPKVSEISKLFLVNPNLATDKSVGFSGINEVYFAGNGWAECEWIRKRRVEISKPLPTELPPERKARLLAKMSPEKRNDPNFVEEYFKRKLDRERRSKRYKFAVKGSISLRICVTPCSLAAQEHLVVEWPLRSALPPRTIAYRFSESNRVEDLGTIGFREPPNVMFVRDNITVVINARGELAGEALPLAQKIDSLIKNQPALTYQQLLARKPSVMIAPYAEKTKAAEQKTVSYEVSAPAGQEIVSVRAYVDGQYASVKDGKIYIVGKAGKVKVKLTATTGELLSNTFEREVIIPE